MVAMTVVVDDQLPFHQNGALCAAPTAQDAQGYSAAWGAFSEKLAAKAMNYLPGLTAGNQPQGWQNLRLNDSSVMLQAYAGSAQPIHRKRLLQCRGNASDEHAERYFKPSAT